MPSMPHTDLLSSRALKPRIVRPSPTNALPDAFSRTEPVAGRLTGAEALAQNRQSDKPACASRTSRLRAVSVRQEEEVEADSGHQCDVKAVLFDMDGVLCDSEELSRSVGVRVLKELYGLSVESKEFVPFVGTGEANFLGGVARKHAAPFNSEQAKQRFFEIYLEEATKPSCSIGYPGAIDLVRACRAAGLKTAVASSADQIKVDANLRAAGFEAATDFDAIISADRFELLKPAPDVFLAAAQAVGIHPQNCVVLEDAPAGIQASRAAGMRCIGVATSLSKEAMGVERPDLVRRNISDIAVQDITGIRPLESLPDPSVANPVMPPQTDVGGWLTDTVELPLGYHTERRELLKLIPLLGIGGALYALQQNAKTLSYLSPKAVLKALSPDSKPDVAAPAGDRAERIAAFKRYIASKEGRGSMERVPDFPAGLSWFNSPPLSIDRQLRGKVLVYDFWTYCCINCIHILPALASLEAKYAGQPFSVVGVHSAKFDNEKDDASIKSAILRYEISHPCVNDAEMVLWRSLGVSSWPTLAVVSPSGDLIATLPGEGQEETVDAFVTAALEFYGERGDLDATPLPIALEREKDSRIADSPLRFPGKIATDLSGNRLFISDSNNHRIVITDLEGHFLDHIGGTRPRLEDGTYDSSAFNRPQGLAYSPSTESLYVADTENHALRKVDLKSRAVQTLAGNGSKGSDFRGGGKGRNQQLNSPWDVTAENQGEAVYVALAGQHQIWRHDVASGATNSLSGDGSERNANGRADRTAWAQPSGLSAAADGRQLWVADSESSSIRSLSLDDLSSKCRVGGDPLFSENLFRFGDRDGHGSEARLQHPLAVCALPDGTVMVADSYNHRLKVLDPSEDEIRSVAGCGVAGFADGMHLDARLSEPSGLAPGPGGTVMVADTNNCVIRKFSPMTGELSTLILSGVPAPRASPNAVPAEDQAVPSGARLISVEPIEAGSGDVSVAIRLPEGYHLTNGARSRFEVTTTKPYAVAVQPRLGSLTADDNPTATIQFRRSGPASLKLGVKIYYCQDDSVCLFEHVVFDVPFTPALSGQKVVELVHTVEAR